MAWDKKKHATFTSGMPEDKKMYIGTKEILKSI